MAKETKAAPAEKGDISEAAQAVIDGHLSKIKELEAKVEVLEKEKKDANDFVSELNELNNALSEKVEELESSAADKAGHQPEKKTAIPNKSFKVGNVEYVFTTPRFTNPLAAGASITAEEALTNKELLEYLVKNDCGVTKRKGA